VVFLVLLPVTRHCLCLVYSDKLDIFY